MKINVDFNYTKQEWFLIKLFTLGLWVYPIIKVIYRYHSIPFPEGLCLLGDYTFISEPPFSHLLTIATLGVSVLYLMERKMVFTTFCIALISVAVFSIERSNGIYHRKELLSAVFIAQFIGYLTAYIYRKKKHEKEIDAKNLAIRLSIQMVAAGYIIAGLTKVQTAGWEWISESPNAVVHVLKSFSQKSIDTQFGFLLEYGRFMVTNFIAYPNLIRAVFVTALLIELCAFIAMFGRRNARIYGCILLTMHLGMLSMMGVFLVAFVGLILIYLINVPAILVSLYQLLVKRKSVIVNKEVAQINGVKQAISFVLLPLLFIALTQLFGENHPFSKFPMYSRFPASADYFYLAEEPGKPISSYKNFNFRTNELKDLLQIRVKYYGANRDSAEELKKPAEEVLKFVVNENRTNPRLKKLQQLYLIRHKIVFQHEQLYEHDEILASVALGE